MPTTYAHDLFGQRVYTFLTPEIKQVIRKNKNLFRIGLHGPDILFMTFQIPESPAPELSCTVKWQLLFLKEE